MVWTTHIVFNQPKPLGNSNLFLSDTPLREALQRELARAWENQGDEGEVVYSRLLTPAAKYSICHQGAPFIGEAMEVLGGIGYCEDSELPHLY